MVFSPAGFMGGKKSSVDALSTCQGVGSAWGFGEVLTLSPSALVACAGWRQEWSNEGFPKAPQGSSSQTPPNQGDDGECSSCPAPQPCLRLPQSCCCWGEPRDGEEPSCSFPTLTWSDSSPHHPVPNSLIVLKLLISLRAVISVPPFSAGFSELQNLQHCRELLLRHPQRSSKLG